VSAYRRTGDVFGSGDCPATRSLWCKKELEAESRAWTQPQTAVAISSRLNGSNSALKAVGRLGNFLILINTGACAVSGDVGNGYYLFGLTPSRAS
jgi:hypothetical protein